MAFQGAMSSGCRRDGACVFVTLSLVFSALARAGASRPRALTACLTGCPYYQPSAHRLPLRQRRWRPPGGRCRPGAPSHHLRVLLFFATRFRLRRRPAMGRPTRSHAIALPPPARAQRHRRIGGVEEALPSARVQRAAPQPVSVRRTRRAAFHTERGSACGELPSRVLAGRGPPRPFEVQPIPTRTLASTGGSMKSLGPPSLKIALSLRQIERIRDEPVDLLLVCARETTALRQLAEADDGEPRNKSRRRRGRDRAQVPDLHLRHSLPSIPVAEVVEPPDGRRVEVRDEELGGVLRRCEAREDRVTEADAIGECGHGEACRLPDQGEPRPTPALSAACL